MVGDAISYECSSLAVRTMLSKKRSGEQPQAATSAFERTKSLPTSQSRSSASSSSSESLLSMPILSDDNSEMGGRRKSNGSSGDDVCNVRGLGMEVEDEIDFELQYEEGTQGKIRKKVPGTL